MMPQKRGLMSAWVILILLCSCSPEQQTPTQIFVVHPTVTLISIPTTPSPTPIKNFTPTPVLSNTPVPTLVFRNTPVPVQNLDLAEAKQKMDFLLGSLDCQLPCFNGLTPGVSSVWEIQDFFAKLGFSDIDNRIVDDNGYLVSRDEQGFWILDANRGVVYSQVPYLITSNFLDKSFLVVGWNDGMVTNINLGPLPYRTWISIPRLYEKLGNPDAIKIGFDAGEGNTVAFILHLYFSAYKTYIVYIIKSASISNVCLNSHTPVDTDIAIGSPSFLLYEVFASRNWNELNGLDYNDLVRRIGTGDFCVPYSAEK